MTPLHELSYLQLAEPTPKLKDSKHTDQTQHPNYASCSSIPCLCKMQAESSLKCSDFISSGYNMSHDNKLRVMVLSVSFLSPLPGRVWFITNVLSNYKSWFAGDLCWQKLPAGVCKHECQQSSLSSDCLEKVIRSSCCSARPYLTLCTAPSKMGGWLSSR